MDRDGKMVFGNKEAIPPKVESSALWYILLGKLTILQNLYKYEPGQEKFSEFFGKNFKDEKVDEFESNIKTSTSPGDMAAGITRDKTFEVIFNASTSAAPTETLY